jgi:hypothetical protein
MAQDWYASSVIDYLPGTKIAASYTNASSALGAPTTNALISVPAFLPNQIVGIGLGGKLTLGFSMPIVRNTSGFNYGMDFTVFGNEFFVIQNSLISTNYGHPGLSVSVSSNNIDYYRLISPIPNYWPNTIFPTFGAGNPGITINPFLSINSFQGLKISEALLLYGGSAGGTPFSLAWATDASGNPIVMDSVSYIRIEGESGFGYVDAVSRSAEPIKVPLIPIRSRTIWRR